MKWANLNGWQKVGLVVGSVASVLLVVSVMANLNDQSERGGELASQVERAFRDSYDWPNDPFWSAIQEFSGRDAPRVTVVTSLANKAENEEVALGICRAVTSISHSVDARFTGVYVTAGKGGPFLAECNVP